MLLVIILLVFHAVTSYAAVWPILSNYSKSSVTYGLGALDDEVDWSQHPCKRQCNGEPMICRYGFTIENYASMSTACYDCPFNVTDCFRPHCIPADGSIFKTLIVVNKRLPGPSIEVCQGDRVVVDVSNNMMDESTSIHWHGIHQRGTPYMDGVPMISQCPIEADDSFRYDFVVDKAGTHFWHSHSGLQRADGLFGPLIVRAPIASNPLAHLYDRDEHVLVLNEWNEFASRDSYVILYHAMGIATLPHTIMINGFGPHGNDSRSAHVPRPVFHVEKGRRYRFRVIQTGSLECPMDIKVDGHEMKVVSSDGADVHPIEVDGIHLLPGERYDFVLDANAGVGNYWIRVKGFGNCVTKYLHQEAILRYNGAANEEPSQPLGYGVGFESAKKILNSKYGESDGVDEMCVPCLLRSLEKDVDSSLDATNRVDHQFYLNFDVYYSINAADYHRKHLYDVSQVERMRATKQINHLSFKTPKFPLQTQPELIGPNYFCNITEAKCTREQCSCTHVLQLNLNSTVELVFVDEVVRMRNGPTAVIFNHPVHLHGYNFRVLAMGKLNYTVTVQQVRDLDRAGKIHRIIKDAPLKDVITVPGGGYTVVRFRADNPGYWFLHCHVDRHAVNGMAMVLKVGEHRDFPSVPKDFPKCFRQSTKPTMNSGAACKTQFKTLLIFSVLLLLRG